LNPPPAVYPVTPCRRDRVEIKPGRRLVKARHRPGPQPTAWCLRGRACSV